MANPKIKSPEEIMKEIDRLKKEYEKAEVELKESRRASVTEAVRKAGADFEEKFKLYLTKRKDASSKQEQVDKLRADISADMTYLNDQYKIMRDTLVVSGAKEEYLVDVLGEPPKAKAAPAAGASTTGKVRTAIVIDGVKMTAVEVSKKYGIPIREGANQRPFAEAGLKEKGITYKVVSAATGEEIKV